MAENGHTGIYGFVIPVEPSSDAFSQDFFVSKIGSNAKEFAVRAMARNPELLFRFDISENPALLLGVRAGYDGKKLIPPADTAALEGLEKRLMTDFSQDSSHPLGKAELIPIGSDNGHSWPIYGFSIQAFFPDDAMEQGREIQMHGVRADASRYALSMTNNNPDLVSLYTGPYHKPLLVLGVPAGFDGKIYVPPLYTAPLTDLMKTLIQDFPKGSDSSVIAGPEIYEPPKDQIHLTH